MATLTPTQQISVRLARAWLAAYDAPRPAGESTDGMHLRIAREYGAGSVTVASLLQIIEDLTGAGR